MAPAEQQSDITSEPPALPLGKYLASSDKEVRDKAVDNLRQFLVSRGTDLLGEKEMTKLWQGLFFCFWHSDKPLVQQALATDLAELLLKIPFTLAALHFLKGFWTMIMREWTKIDRYRIDKFYMLIRRFVNASFRLQLRERWNENCCEAYEYILSGRGGPLDPDDPRKATSVACHLADIWLQELEKVMAEPNNETVPIIDAIYPFISFVSRTPMNTAYTRISDALLQPFLDELTATVSSEDDGEPRAKRRRMLGATKDSAPYENVITKSVLNSRHFSSELDGTVDAAATRTAYLKTLFDVASGVDTREANRKKMYALWKVGMANGRGDASEWDGS